jgi:hypothetical protein
VSAPPVRLIVFAKAPVRGAVKTRLGRGIGAGAATAWYRRALVRTQRIAAEAGLASAIFAAPSSAAFGKAVHVSGLVHSQSGGDLGARMADAARRARGPSLIVGCDIPGLTAVILRQAARALLHHDLVLGPARDGGFYLVGVKSPAHVFRLYDHVRWSSEHAMADTLARAPKHWRIAFAPVLRDVDEAEDLAAIAPAAGA